MPRKRKTWTLHLREANVGFLRFILLSIILIAPMCAQVAPSPDAPPAEGPVQPTTETRQISSPQPTFQVTANLVNLFFVVRGSHGKLVPNLSEADCDIQEDNTNQTLKSFIAQSNLPLTLGILLDTSLSQQRVLPTEQQAGTAFLRRILRPTDEAFLISFDVDAAMLSDFTNSPGRLARAINSAHINSTSGNYANGTIPAIGKPKGTVLYDAVYLAANDKLRQEAGRKALILLTDGEDEGSQENLKSAIEAAQKANAIVYVLLIRDSGAAGVFDDYGIGPMRKLAQATGGRVFQAGGNGRKMQAAFDEIEKELRSQYQASYTPTNSARDGLYRHIHVACQQNGEQLKVQARQGYYALAH
jgi:VWFA-related protein